MATRMAPRYTECAASSGNKIKHYISEIIVDVKLCSISFGVVALPVRFCFLKDHLLGARGPLRQLSSVPFCFN